MKWTIPFLAVICVTLAMPKNERAFSLFSVVTFPNNECTTTESADIQGICHTAEECGESGGTQSGNCASGFGVCCYHTIVAAGEITNNLTYIQNDGYPSTTGTSAATQGKTHKYTVAGGASICQVRLDFDDVELIQPEATGVCTATTHDQLIVESPSAKNIGLKGNLCGILSGQHMYIHNDGAATAATITVDIGTDSIARKWKIKVTQIECDSMARAPVGCLQYYTGSAGTIKSFNHVSSTATNRQMIENQEYSVCIRTEAGMCTFSVTQTTLTPSNTDFDLNGSTTVGTGPTPSTEVATAVVGAVCATDATATNVEQTWIVIPNTSVAEPKYCGGLLAPLTGSTKASPVISNVKPFSIGVVSLTALNGATGFSVNYSQIPC